MFEGTIEDDAMMNAPVYETHKRGKNWMAIINVSPTSPGGLGRIFIKKGQGPYYYMTNKLKLGMPVEFGADYYNAKGSRSVKRWYGVIRELTNTKITIEQFNTGRDAIKHANPK